MAATAIPIDTLPSINPATGEVLAHFERTPASQLPEIISRARIAQSVWAKLPIRNRCEKLRGLRDRIMASRKELADAVVRESGKPRVEALFADIFVALDSAEYWSRNAASALRTRRVPHHSTAAKAKRGYLAYDPLGVIAIISSWNYPLAIPLSQIIPAVAAGNAVVCKTSDFTPQCGALIEKLFIDAGFPNDLVKIVQGGGEVGQALIDASPDKVMFTGSVATGRRVAEACAKRLIPSVLELGGKDAMIVLADADLEVASSAAVWGGAKLLCGGSARPELGPNFFEPTVIAGVDSPMKLFQEETFGPILAIQVVRDAKEAITRANDSPFALAASIWTKNKSRGMALAVELRAGAVMVNDAISYFGIAEAPHGGCGASGWGRTHGKAGLLEMVQMKYIDVDGLPRSEKPWWYRYGSDLERAADAFLQFEFSDGIAAKLRNARSALKTFFRDHGL